MNDLIEQGIEALRGGDKDHAYQLLSQATTVEPDNAKAWYYLAGATPSRAERRQALERVLKLMPDNEKARAALDQMEAEDAPTTVDDAFEKAVNAAEDTAEDVVSRAEKVVNATDREMNRKHGETVIKTGSGAGFKLPVSIPGAPQTVDPQNALQDFRTIFMNGIEVLKGNEQVYHAELRQATWWRFWLYVAVGSVIVAVLSTISSTLIANQLASATESLSRGLGVNVSIARPNIVNIFMTLILTAPLQIATMYGGIYAAQWWLTNQKSGNGALFEFAYALILPAMTAALLTSTIGLVGAILPFISFLTGILALVISIVAWWRAAQGIAHVHNVPVQWTAVLAIIVYVIASIIVGFVLGLILSPFLIASSVSIF